MNGSGVNLDWTKGATTKLGRRLKERRVNHVRLSDSTDLKNTFIFGKQIGQGGFGTVISVFDKNTEKYWALKIVTKAAVGDKIDTVYREINILKMVEHPHIIHLEKVFESSKNIYMVLELCFSTLATVYRQKKRFSEEDTRKIIKDLTSAVSYLHKNDIVHRDLKLENILIAKNPNDENDKLYIKVTDFGLSIVKKGNDHENMLHDYCGTLVYMAPEIITSHSYSQQCDVWAIGIITYMLLYGTLPFYSTQETKLTTMICHESPGFAKISISPEAIDLLTKLLNKNPALRATALEVLQHPWIVGELIRDSDITENVLDMMRLWRSELMLPVGAECDWVSKAKAISTSSGTSNAGKKRQDANGGSNCPATSTVTRDKQSMHLLVKNTRLGKTGGKRTDQQDNKEGRKGGTQQLNTNFLNRTKSHNKDYKK